MNKPPAFQFYVKDWRSSPTVLMMDDHEKAVFIDMLVASWESDEQGTLPLPLEISAKVCGRNVRSLKSFLRKFPQTFVEVSGKLVNQKLYDQGLTYRNLSIKRREAAKEGRANAQHLLHSASASASATTKEEEKPLCANQNRSHGSGSPESIQKPPDESPDAVKRVWSHYIEKLGKDSRLLTFTPTRKQKGLARLAECLKKTSGDLPRAEALMCCAVDALAGSAYHRGENDKKTKYDSWEGNLFKSQEQLEKWLERA